jgi:hypothetical protein
MHTILTEHLCASHLATRVIKTGNVLVLMVAIKDCTHTHAHTHMYVIKQVTNLAPGFLAVKTKWVSLLVLTQYRDSSA